MPWRSPARTSLRTTLALAGLLAGAGAGAAAAFMIAGRDLAYPAPIDLPQPPLHALLRDEESVLVPGSRAWQKIMLRAPAPHLEHDASLWRRLHFDDWDRLDADLRSRGLHALVAHYAHLLSAGAARWESLRPVDWDRVPQPVRALVFLAMVRAWADHYRPGDAFSLDHGEVTATVGAIVMVESWFEHRAVNAGSRGNVDLGLAQASTPARAALQRLARAGRVDFAPAAEADYLDPWQASRVAVLWFGLMLEEAAGDLDLAVRAYHVGIGEARRGQGQEYLDNVRSKRRRFVLGRDAPPAWTRLQLLAARPWLAPPAPQQLAPQDPRARPGPRAQALGALWPRACAARAGAASRVAQQVGPARHAGRLAGLVHDARRHARELARGLRRFEARHELAGASIALSAGDARSALAAYGRACRADASLHDRLQAPMAFAHHRLSLVARPGSFARRLHAHLAVHGYEQALLVERDLDRRRRLLGWLALAHGPEGDHDRDAFVDALLRLRVQAPAGDAVHLILARTLEAAGDPAAAEAALRAGASTRPHSRVLSRELARLLERRDQARALIAELRQQRRRWPRDANVHAALALHCWDLLDPGPALALAGSASQATGASPAAAEAAAAWRATCEREGEASADAALDLEPDDPMAASLKSLYLRRRAAAEPDDARRAALEQRAAHLRERAAAHTSQPTARGSQRSPSRTMRSSSSP